MIKDFEEYINQLKSSEPTPGGGSATSLISIVSVSLILMSINVTMKRKSYSKYDDEDKELIESCKEMLEESYKSFDSLEEDDRKAFENYMEVYKDGSEDEKQTAIEMCFLMPYLLFILVHTIYDRCLDIKELIVDSIQSDYCIGMNNLLSCLQACLENMNINLKYSNKPELLDKYKQCVELFEEDTKYAYGYFDSAESQAQAN